MSKTRVKKGETYWRLAFAPCGIVVDRITDTNDVYDRQTFDSGNYFHTEEVAEAMAKKLRAVLNGADVIEMPSEEEIKERLDTIMPHGPVESWCVEGYCKHILDWLKSKIVK